MKNTHFGVTFHSMGGNAESELHPALSSLNLVSSSRHARHLHVHALKKKDEEEDG